MLPLSYNDCYGHYSHNFYQKQGLEARSARDLIPQCLISFPCPCDEKEKGLTTLALSEYIS